MNIKVFAVFALGMAAVPVFAATPIGVVSSLGAYSTGETSVNGINDLFDGTALQTTTQPVGVLLQNGVDLRLATRSSGSVYSNHLALKDGAVRVNSFDEYSVEAKGLRIQSDAPDAQAIIRLNGKTVEIASLGGELRVTDGGAMLTRVASGTKMAFQQTGAAATTQQPKPNGQILPISDRTVLLWTSIIVGVTAAGIGGYVLSR